MLTVKRGIDIFRDALPLPNLTKQRLLPNLLDSPSCAARLFGVWGREAALRNSRACISKASGIVRLAFSLTFGPAVVEEFRDGLGGVRGGLVAYCGHDRQPW